MTQKKLADRIGVGQVTIANYERGVRFPGESTLKSLARAVDISLDSLLSEGSRRITQISDNHAGFEKFFSLESMLDILLNKKSASDWQYLKGWLDIKPMSLDEIYSEILIPLLDITGRRWLEGKISIAQEHLVTGKIRELVILTSEYLQKEKKLVLPSEPRWMGVCAPGEQHDLALLMNAQLMKHQGWEVFFLGTGVPISDLLDMIDKYSPWILGISLTMTSRMDDLEVYLRALEEKIKSGLTVFLGGQGVNSENISRFPAVTRVVRNLEESKTIARNMHSQYTKKN